MAAASKHCYLPSKNLPASDDVACFPELEDSSCCGKDQTCLTNGLCMDPQTNATSRASCTDSTWISSDCPQYCLKNAFPGTGGKDFANGHPHVWQCSNQLPADAGLICCDISEINLVKENSCCPDNEPNNLFSIGSKLGGAPITSIALSSLSSSLPTNSPSFSPISSLATSNSASSSLAIPDSTSSSSATSTPSTQNASGKNNSTTIAIAVSTSIGAILLIIAACYLYRRGRKSRVGPIQSRMEPTQSKMEPIHNPARETFEMRVLSTQEISAEQVINEVPGFQRFEMWTEPQYLRSELPQ